MRVLILADRSLARREHAMLSRLEVGLADEGVRVVHAVPRSALDSEFTGLYSTAVMFEDSGFAITRRSRVRRLLNAIAATEPEGEENEGFAVVHAFGVGSWPFAMELGRACGAGVMLELWRSSAIAQASGIAGSSGNDRAHFIVSESEVAKALRKRVATARVYGAPWGVHAPSTVRAPYSGGRPLAVAVLADTGDAKACGAALAGLAEATKAGSPGAPPGVLVFFGSEDCVPSRDSAIWGVARKLGLLDRLSMVPEMEARREPILQMDMLVLPEASGRQRTLALEAMGAGMLVVAAADPFVESLADGVTAKLVKSQTTEAWAAAFRELLANRETAAHLASSAHAWVRENRTASDQVAAILKAYDQVMQARPAASARA